MRGREDRNLVTFILAGSICALSKTAAACSVCFGGQADDPSNRALRNGVLLLMAVAVVVLAFFARFFLNIRKRTR